MARTAVALALLSAALCVPGRAYAAQTAALQAHLLWSNVDAAEMDRQLDQAKAAGAGLVRVDAGWSSLEEQGKGVYSSWHLSRMDAVVSKAEARGLKVLFTWWTTPCWASSAPADLKQGCDGAWWDRGVDRYPPTNAGDYADSLGFLVRRYGSRVAAWEIWNEPNLDYFFRTPDKAARYAALVKAGYAAAKQAHPGATIVAGSVSDSDFGFIEALYRDHALKGHFDAVSIHPYSGDLSPLDPREDQYIRYSFVRGVPAVRDVMLRYGDDKPLWLTEFGWSTCNYRGGPSWANCVDESTQATYLRDAFAQLRSWPYVPVAVWFNLRATTSDPADRVGNYGLLRYDGSPKPSYAAFRDAAAGLNVTTAEPAPTPPPSGTSTTPTTDTTSPTRPPKGRKKVRGVSASGPIDIRRRRGRVHVSGEVARAGVLRVSAFRYDSRRRRFARRPTFRLRLRVTRAGRFHRVLADRRLRRGTWRLRITGAGLRPISVRLR